MMIIVGIWMRIRLGKLFGVICRRGVILIWLISLFLCLLRLVLGFLFIKKKIKIYKVKYLMN